MSDAFTAIELLIVLLVLGVLAGIAAPRFRTAIAWQRLEAAAQRVAADLRLARNQAVRTSSPMEVVFFPLEERYTIDAIDDPNHPGRGYQLRLGDTENAVEVIDADFSGSTTVTFDIHGRPDSAGTIRIGYGPDEREITVAENGRVDAS